MIMRRSKLARYFSRRHSKVVEAEKRVVVYLWREEEEQQQQRDTLADQGHSSTITADDSVTQTSSVVEQTPSGPTEPRTTATAPRGPTLDIQPVSPFLEQPEQFAPGIRLQDERVSICSISSHSNSSAINVQRQLNHNPSDTSTNQDTVPPLHPTPTESLDDYRRSPSIRSESPHHSTTPSYTSADFESPDFAELMDGLVVVMSKLNPRTDSVVDEIESGVGVDSAEVITVAVPDTSRYSGYIDMVPRISEENEEEYDVENINEKKTEESRSTIWR